MDFVGDFSGISTFYTCLDYILHKMWGQRVSVNEGEQVGTLHLHPEQMGTSTWRRFRTTYTCGELCEVSGVSWKITASDSMIKCKLILGHAESKHI